MQKATDNVMTDDYAPEIPAEQVLAFCRSPRAQACFANWSPETLRDYLAFHRAQGTLFLTAVSGRLDGLAVAWQCARPEIWELGRAGLNGAHAFRWQPTKPWGDMLFVAEVAAADRAALAALCRRMAARFPDWERQPVWTFRRGVIHRIETGALRELLQ